MAFNSFVNFGDIKGESTDKDHKDWVMIELLVVPKARPSPQGGFNFDWCGRQIWQLRQLGTESAERKFSIGMKCPANRSQICIVSGRRNECDAKWQPVVSN